MLLSFVIPDIANKEATSRTLTSNVFTSNIPSLKFLRKPNELQCNLINQYKLRLNIVKFYQKKLAVSKHEVLSEQTPPLSRYTTSGIHEISNISLML